MENYVDVFEIYKRGKKRQIISYKNSKEGRKLHNEHVKLLRKLTKYPSSNLSYAYKKNIATKNAFENHYKSILFIKMDIKDFFGSITLEKFCSFVQLKDDLNDKIETCFWNDALPLGFVTSPKLSDMYLYGFDVLIEEYLKSHPLLHYSRYCDDILISTEENNFGSLHTFASYIEKKLKDYNLFIKGEKTREFDLNKDTSVRFLGLNLSLKDGEYKITISKSFILKTLDIIEETYSLKEKYKTNYYLLKKEDYWNKYYGKENDEESESVGPLHNIYKEYMNQRKIITFNKSVIKSRVAYIKYNSEISYKRFLKKHNNKFDKRWGEIWL